MKTKSKIALVFAITIILVFTIVSPALAAPELPIPDDKVPPEIIDYVAMGDSGAAGVRAVQEIGQLPGWEKGSRYGYTDLIAEWLDEQGVVGMFDEKYCVSGNTAEVLAVQSGRPDAQQRFKQAEIVTITIGANDFLGPLYAYFDSIRDDVYSMSPEEIIYGAGVAIGQCVNLLMNPAELMAFKNNMVTIFENVLDANPNAKIYVMGYYNPLPCVEELLGAGAFTELTALIEGTLNTAIQGAIFEVDPSMLSIRYIATVGTINNGYWDYAYDHGYLYYDSPFPYSDYYYGGPYAMADIHLTEAGYAKVAELFEAAITLDFGL